MAVGITSNTCSTISSISLVPQDQIRFRCTTDYSGDLIKRLYHADNLDVLNSLIKDESVCGKIDLIYMTLHIIQVVLLKREIQNMHITIILPPRGI